MAQYTHELRRYIDSFSQYSSKPLSIKERINIGQPHLFDFDYPFFDESKRKDFERKWIRRFYMTEVGFETIELFKFHLENWMNEKMPYYNQRFESELIKFDPLKNTEMQRDKTKSIDGSRNDDVTTTGNKNGTFHIDTKENGSFDTQTANDNESKGNNSGTMSSDGTVDNNGTSKNDETGTKKGNNSNTSDGTNFARVLEEETPDGRLDITTEDGKGIIRYASKINENTGKDHNQENINIDENTSKNSTGETTDKSVTHDEANTKSASDSESHDVGKATGTNGTIGNKNGKTNEKFNENENYVGKIGVETYSEMLTKYRETFLRIESEIYDECRKDLFMLVY